MKIYYYHTRPIEEALKEWEKHLHPGHILYGLTHFNKYGITPILHPFRRFSSRLKLSFYNFFLRFRAYYILPRFGIIPQTYRHLASPSRSPQPQPNKEHYFTLLLQRY